MFGLDDIGDLVGGAISFLGGERRNDAQLQQAREANAFSAQQFATRYQTTTKDMQAAGLNPMLAYSQGGGSPPSGQQAVMQDTVTPAVERYNQTKLNSAQVANVEADTLNKRAQSHLIEAQANQANATADQARQNINLIDTQARKILEEIKNIPSEGARLKAATQQLMDHAEFLHQQGKTQTQIRSQLEATVRKLNLETDLLKYDKDAAETMGNLGRTSQQAKTVLDVLRLLKK